MVRRSHSATVASIATPTRCDAYRSVRERRRPPLRTALGVLVGLLQSVRKPYATVGLDSGGGIRTRDLRVMSPTSYQTAPPRGGTSIIPPQGRLGEGSSLSMTSGGSGPSPS